MLKSVVSFLPLQVLLPYIDHSILACIAIAGLFVLFSPGIFIYLIFNLFFKKNTITNKYLTFNLKIKNIIILFLIYLFIDLILLVFIYCSFLIIINSNTNFFFINDNYSSLLFIISIFIVFTVILIFNKTINVLKNLKKSFIYLFFSLFLTTIFYNFYIYLFK
jgi:hypothetical protein